MERTGIVTIHKNPLTLVGPALSPGDRAPDFTALANDMSPKSLADFSGKVLVLAAVPSLDTPVCEVETKRFNREAAALGPDVALVTVSMDLPFAQKRFCAAEGITALTTLSDHRDADFGLKYGVLIKELRLLARSVFVADRAGILRYVEIVPETSQEPDYEKALAAVKALL